jgi:hypothetical protein
MDPDLELEIHKLWDHKEKFGIFPVRSASAAIEKLKACRKKEKAT